MSLLRQSSGVVPLIKTFLDLVEDFDVPAMHCNNGEENLIAEYAVFHYID